MLCMCGILSALGEVSVLWHLYVFLGVYLFSIFVKKCLMGFNCEKNTSEHTDSPCLDHIHETNMRKSNSIVNDQQSMSIRFSFSICFLLASASHF